MLSEIKPEPEVSDYICIRDMVDEYDGYRYFTSGRIYKVEDRYTEVYVNASKEKHFQYMVYTYDMKMIIPVEKCELERHLRKLNKK